MPHVLTEIKTLAVVLVKSSLSNTSILEITDGETTK